MRLKNILAATLFALAAMTAAAHATTVIPFTPQAFAAAQKAGKPILVDVWASWCPICKAQQPTLSAIESDPANKALTIYRVDFDSQKDVVKSFGVRMQSTLIVFHGATEKGRATGETDPARIRALVARAR